MEAFQPFFFCEFFRRALIDFGFWHSGFLFEPIFNGKALRGRLRLPDFLCRVVLLNGLHRSPALIAIVNRRSFEFSHHYSGVCLQRGKRAVLVMGLMAGSRLTLGSGNYKRHP